MGGGGKGRAIRFSKTLPDLTFCHILTFCLIFADGVSITLFCNLKDLEEVIRSYKVKNCLDAKWPVLLYKILIFWKFFHFYYIK